VAYAALGDGAMRIDLELASLILSAAKALGLVVLAVILVVWSRKFEKSR